ncbi:MAG: outer membrane protein assembly factor BamD (BamD/ComL family) [Candidatus Azotimanducaceae bacterium]
MAENLLAEWPDVALELRKTALLIIGHGRFEADEFVAAEEAYHQLLAMALTVDEQGKVHERLLASVYKQAEALEAEGEIDGAVANYLRIAAIDPLAPMAAQGHFDAVAAIETQGRVTEAAALLQEFRVKYPKHDLAQNLDMRLAAMYEHSGDLQRAVLEYLSLSERAPDKEARRQAKYRSAEIFLALKDTEKAIEHFRDYAHTYEKPQAIALEAMHHMDELYQRTGETDKQRFWLGKKIDAHRAMGSGATERSTYLAASAQFVFASDEKQKFGKITLTHPLKKSLRRKQSALKKTLKAYELAAGYKVAEFATASTFEIADLYRSLSKSILVSDRPKNLSELEMAQYEILLEEQAYPFEEQAISLHEINQQKSWAGIYDEWVEKSFVELAELMPGRYKKPELEVGYAQAIH